MSNKRMFLDPINGEVHDEDYFDGRKLDTLIEAFIVDDDKGIYAYEINLENLENMEINSVKVLSIFADIVRGLGESLEEEMDEEAKHFKTDMVRRIASIMLVKALKLQKGMGQESLH